MTTSRFVYVTYCDDIRQEVGNKLSFMGCYSADLLLNRVEGGAAVLPKLCAHVRVVTPIDQPFEALSVRALFNDEQVAEVSVPPGQLPTRSAEGGIPSDSVSAVVEFSLTFSPFAVGEDGGKLRIVALTEGGEIRGNSLRVKLRSMQGVADLGSPESNRA